MNAKQMLRRLERDDDVLTAHLDALSQVVPTAPVFDGESSINATSMIEAHLRSSYQTLGATLQALSKVQQGFAEASAELQRPHSPPAEVVDVQAREVGPQK